MLREKPRIRFRSQSHRSAHQEHRLRLLHPACLSCPETGLLNLQLNTISLLSHTILFRTFPLHLLVLSRVSPHYFLHRSHASLDRLTSPSLSLFTSTYITAAVASLISSPSLLFPFHTFLLSNFVSSLTPIFFSLPSHIASHSYLSSLVLHSPFTHFSPPPTIAILSSQQIGVTCGLIAPIHHGAF